MEYVWLPVMGEFQQEGTTLVFKGAERTYKNVSGDETIGADIGNLLFAKSFGGGSIYTEVEFSEISEATSCEIILYYNDDGINKHMVTAGIFNRGAMFEIRDFDGKQWTLRAATGDARNLKAGTKYYLEVSMNGSRVNMSVNGVEILSTVLPYSVQTSQIGIWCQDYNDIFIHEFKVNAELPKAFVVMQFKSPYNELYVDVIKTVCEELGIQTVRADESYSNEMIIADIVNQITESKFIIADITPHNPNVYYEVGYAHALNKPTILLAEDVDNLPFDVSPFRVLIYENSIAGKKKIEEGLKKHIKEIVYKR